MSMTRFARLGSIALGVAALTASSAWAQAPGGPVTSDDAGSPPDGSAPAPSSPAPTATPAPAPPVTTLPIELTGVVVATAGPAPQPAPPSFGRRGQVVVLGGSSVGLSSSTFDGSSASFSSYGFSPDLAYFVTRNVSIGVAINASYSDAKGYGANSSLVDTRTTALAAGPQFGLNVPLGASFSWFPRVTVGFEWTKVTEQLVEGESLSIAGSGVGYPSTTQLGPYIDISAPLLLQATDHFFFGFGPELFHDFGTVSGGPNVGGQKTAISAELVVGGYWGGEPPPGETQASRAAPTRPAERFGSAGEFVLSNDLVLSARSLNYAGTDSTERTFSIGGSLDYFVIDHVSVGFATTFSTAYSRGIDPTTGAVINSSTGGVTFAPRLGADVPLGDSFSIYPQFELGIGHQTYDETGEGSGDQYVDDTVSVDLYVPLLVHPAPHVFIGFGPSVYHQVSSAVTYPADPLVPAVQNRETTVGARLVVGGWL